MSKLQKKMDEKGNLISPVLNESIRNFLIDIDGTITDDIPKCVHAFLMKML